MSTVTIIVAIVCLLGVLVSYAFIQQTMKNKREHRARMVSALKSRSRNFKFMLNGFPKGFLTKELILLVQRSLVDVSEQLTKLEPDVPQHMQDFQLISAQMTENQRQAKPAAPPALENHQQIKEVKACLEELHKFVYRLEEKQTIARNQGQHFRAQIKQMVLQVSVDAYCLNGGQASKSGKTKLALHYYETALSLILREAKSDRFKTKVAQLKELVERLKEQLAEETSTAQQAQQENSEQQAMDDEWDKFSDNDDMWKKKNVYD